ncbi:conserved hypothetical protein [Culex quinquefasciatus]|uniref:Uncharacterized protein n=1 Tax=Culex quinquefasciatus TaxID=7176 RepID=B0X9Q6_CULQU|nr:conserved hypothetical protein [Culex quinquefasciatus]|eukprot:XP_001866378.1 conserved hypothetical protein [Culex quinquefasciatus]
MAPSGASGARGKDDGDPQAECVFRCRLALGAKSMATPGDSRQPEVPVNDADDHSGRLGSGVSCRLFPGVGAEDGDVNRLVTPEVPSAVQEGSRPVSRCQTMSTGRLKLRGHFLRELTIEQSDHFMYMGTIFDQKGTWGKHINYLKQKCLQKTNFLRSVSGNRWGAHPSDLLRLYKTTILSVLEYGSFCFQSAAKSRLLVLQRIQYRSLRIVLGCMHSTHNMTLEVLAGVLPLRTRYYELSYRFLIRCDYRNKLVIDNFETLLNLHVESRRMLLYYDFMSSWEWSPSTTVQRTPPLTSSTLIGFDTSMKADTRGIPNHLLRVVVPSIFASKYSHVPPNNRFFTDGSKLDGCTGFGVYHESYQLFFKLLFFKLGLRRRVSRGLLRTANHRDHAT